MEQTRDLDRLYSDGGTLMPKREWLKTLNGGECEFEAAVRNGHLDESTIVKSDDDPPFI